MKLTNKGRYAVMAMAELAKHDRKTPINLSEISIRQGISISFLEQIFLQLKNKDLVQSVRGPSGGYILMKSPEDITKSFSKRHVDALHIPLEVTPNGIDQFLRAINE